MGANGDRKGWISGRPEAGAPTGGIPAKGDGEGEEVAGVAAPAGGVALGGPKGLGPGAGLSFASSRVGNDANGLGAAPAATGGAPNGLGGKDGAGISGSPEDGEGGPKGEGGGASEGGRNAVGWSGAMVKGEAAAAGGEPSEACAGEAKGEGAGDFADSLDGENGEVVGFVVGSLAAGGESGGTPLPSWANGEGLLRFCWPGVSKGEGEAPPAAGAPKGLAAAWGAAGAAKGDATGRGPSSLPGEKGEDAGAGGADSGSDAWEAGISCGGRCCGIG